MKALAIFINLAGPIRSPQHGLCHQLEIGLKPEDGNADTARLVLKTESTVKAINESCEFVKKFITKYYPKQAGGAEAPTVEPDAPPAPPPSNLIVLPCEEINSTALVKG